MRFYDLMLTAIKNLYQRKARTILTILGVIIGTMSITLMISLGIGSRQQFDENVMQSQDLSRITVMKYGMSGETKLDTKALAEFGAIANVQHVLPLKQSGIGIKNSKYVADTHTYFVPLSTLSEIYKDKLVWGAYEPSAQMQFFIGEDTAMYDIHKKGIGDDIWSMPLAENVDFQTEAWDAYIGSLYYYSADEEVLPEGVLAPPKQKAKAAGMFKTQTNLGYGMYVDISYADDLVRKHKKFAEAIGIDRDYSEVWLFADDIDNVLNILQSVKDLGYEAYSDYEYIKQMQEESARQQLVWGAVGAIALLVSAIGIANTMLTSIMERRKEIGVLKVLGCSLGRINAMFLLEAAVIGLLGGAIGVGLSYLFSMLVKVDALSTYGEGLRFVITPILAVLSMAGAAAVGMIAGVYPAWRATKMSAMDALRNE